MDVVKEANLEYESELKRNPDSTRIWLNYITETKSCSHEVWLIQIPSFPQYSLVPDVALQAIS